MRHALIFTLLLLTCAQLTSAQNLVLKGVLKDKADSSTLKKATIRLTSPTDNTFKKQVFTDNNGAFEITDLKPQAYLLTISFLGYGELVRAIMLQTETQDLGVIKMPKSSRELREVVIKGQVPPAQQKGDTLAFNADAYKTNPDASGEDLVKKMPGITVENGNVKAQGEDVRKVLVDGKEFFGEDATLALRNLPAEAIQRIEVFDRMSDQAQFTGFDDGNSQKTINIVTRAEMRQGQFGKIFAGYGTEGRYSAGGNVNLFNQDRRISIIGMTNNVNQQNFSSQDLLGVQNAGSGGGGGRGGGGGGRGGGGGGRGGGGGGGSFGGGGGGGSSNFLTGTNRGLNKTNSIGVNFNDNFGKKVTFNGSYFFNNSNTSNNEINREEQTLEEGQKQIDTDTSYSSSSNYNHRINMRIEYKIDSNNSIIFTPGISFQNNNSYSESFGNTIQFGKLLADNMNNSSASNSGYNLNGNIMYRHAFAKRGRTISLSLGLSTNDRSGTTYRNSDLNYYDGSGKDDSLKQKISPLSDGQSYNANIAYTEPIGKSGQLQINYNPTYSKNSSDRRAYQYDFLGSKDYSILDSAQSNMFENTAVTQNAGITYRLGNRDKMLSVGVSYQHTEMTSDRIFPFASNESQSFTNILPNAMLMYKLSEYSRIRVFYRSSMNQPSIQQLQDGYFKSGLLNYSVGDPKLRPQFGHMVAARYNYTNTVNNNNFFANIFLQTNNDYLTNAVFTPSRGDSVLQGTDTLKRGGRLTQAKNMDGFVSVRSFFTYGVPLKFIKSNFNLNTGVSYQRTPGQINQLRGFTHNYTYSAGVLISSNISEYVDFTLSYNGNFNTVKNTIDPSTNSDYSTHTASGAVNLLTKSGWVLQNEVNYQFNRGLGGDLDKGYILWNAGIGKKFLKNQRGELRASVFDLLKQNRAISRTVNGLSIVDSQSQVLTQYFMLTFTYRLKNFGKLNMPTGGRERFNRLNGAPDMMNRPF
ncbi:outer membrane beta-barrel protein [Chitinophaga niabensis]|uniref:Outer membrane receptor proteins, mostly Fe transport n=1 Tax=Chitinophaga niabensis TaxID=536979 RepID=A0A1N6FE02_9BACT|nr:outer membrane beta-barrel protein [Chitinophaga niabensis]SIN93444.1 Outer membrane receptor proteins, mostly Fe transport [Chitinophaga niabensis]